MDENPSLYVRRDLKRESRFLNFARFHDIHWSIVKDLHKTVEEKIIDRKIKVEGLGLKFAANDSDWTLKVMLVCVSNIQHGCYINLIEHFLNTELFHAAARTLPRS